MTEEEIIKAIEKWEKETGISTEKLTNEELKKLIIKILYEHEKEGK